MDFLFWWYLSFSAVEGAVAIIASQTGHAWWPAAACALLFFIGFGIHVRSARKERYRRELRAAEMRRRLREVETQLQQNNLKNHH